MMVILVWVVAGALAGVGVWAVAPWRLVRPLESATAGGLGGFLSAVIFVIARGSDLSGFEALPAAIAVVGGAALVAVFGFVAERELLRADGKLSSRG
jgi:hypothetical protein